MARHIIVKLAASTLILGVTLAGCKSAADESRPGSVSKANTKGDQRARASADEALKAAQKGDWAAAVGAGENAVALSPRDAGYRAALGDIYLKAGRFQSASAAYTDALVLNPGDSKALLSLALTQIALGRAQDARATLDAGSLPPADHGLALALAGDTEGAIRLLSAAAREPSANGRLRQNLALAYALAGDWTQARTLAAQDVSPAEIDERLASWAEFARPNGAPDQVAALLGVTPAADPGQPVRLALAPAPAADAPVAVAVAAPQPEPVALAVAAPVDTIEEPAALTAEPVQAPVVTAAVAAVEQVLPRPMASPVSRTIRAAAAAPAALRGRYVVQLGAFAGRDRVENAWNGAVAKLSRLADYIPASTRFTLASGTSLTRLSVGGFATHRAASQLCASLRQSGGVCFVREVAGDSRVRWASLNARNG